MNIAILGASDKKERYSFQALKLLLEYQHDVFPVNPALKEIRSCFCYKDLRAIDRKIDIITIYLNAAKNNYYLEQIMSCSPGLVIFNPGAENKSMTAYLEKQGISCINACTLVLLKTGQL